MLILVLLLAFGVSAALTGAARRYALSRAILDHPNERSSHTAATPRGGGVAIVAVSLAGLAAGAGLGWLGAGEASAIAAAGLLVAAVGWWDDQGGLPARWRFLAHLAGSAVVVAWFGPVARLTLGSFGLDLGWLAFPLNILGVTWLINLTNFMDGIDGIAGGEVLFIAVAAGGFAVLEAQTGLMFQAWLFASACAGFLLWNWPPAKIFLGDVGSGFLGLLVGVLILAGTGAHPDDFWALTILPGAFVVDATFTLLRRMFGGGRWYTAHRSHAYQHSAQRWGHRNVTLAIGAINLAWILPMAWAARQSPQFGAALMVVAWAPLLVLSIWQRAGLEGHPARSGSSS